MVPSNRPPLTEPSRRYRTPISGWVFILFVLTFFLLVAVASTLVRAGLLLVVAMWVLTLLATIYLVRTMLATYVDIGPDDILIRMPRKTHVIAWDELDEIRWVREGHAEFAYLCTSDGRQVRFPFGVSALGVGERHVRRMIDDAEQAWRRHSRKQAASSGRPVRAFRRTARRTRPSRYGRAG